MGQPTSNQLWIQSPVWDGVWMFAGIWAPALMGLTYLLVSGFTDSTLPLTWEGEGAPSSFFLFLFLGMGILHRMSTTYSVLATPILKEGIQQDPWRYQYLPALILVGCLLLAQAFAFHSVFESATRPRAELWGFFALAYVMVLWERWHFCMQEFGVLSIYRFRAKQFAVGDRRFDRVFVVVLMLAVSMTLYVCFNIGGERNVLLHGTPFSPPYDGVTLERVGLAAIVIATVAVVAALGRELMHPNRSLPKLLFYLLVGSHAFVLYFFPEALGLYFLANVFHHWMVAIGLFNRVNINSYGPQSRLDAAKVHLVRVGPFFAGCLLFYLFYGSLDRAGNLLPLPDTTVFLDSSVLERVGIGLITGLFFAFNFLHFYYDRCLFRFSDPVVRKNVGPLVFGPDSTNA